MEMHEIRGEEAPAPAPAAFAGLDYTQQLTLQAAAVAELEGGGGLISFGNRSLQAARFFLVWGYCVLIDATVMNPAANLEHKFAGFVVLTICAWLALLTLAGAGAGAGRAAERAERFLRGCSAKSARSCAAA